MEQAPLEQMLEQGQDNVLLRYTLGSLCLQKELFEEAVSHLERALEHDRNHPASWRAYGKALAGCGRTSDAIAAYRNGIEIASERGDVQTVKEMRVFLKRLEAAQ